MTEDEIREAARESFNAVVEEAGDNWMGYSHQQDAYLDGFAAGYWTAQGDGR